VTPLLGETADGEKVTRSGPEILPDTVIYDVELTMTLPWPTTVTSSVNALAHAVEALYAADRTAESDQSATQAIQALASGLNALRHEHESLDARSDLLLGAWLAGTCLGAVAMGLHHKLCHTLGGSFGVAHAPTHTVVLPFAMEYNQPAATEAMSTAAAALGVDDAASGLQDLIKGWGGPMSLGELGFATDDIPRAAELATRRPYPNPRDVRRDDVADLLARATSGTTIGTRS
jgi:alcohol dehydrogenase class IV